METFRTWFFLGIFVLSFSANASAETPGEEAENKDSEQTTQVQIDELITIVNDEEYDSAEAEKMVERIHSIHDNILQGLVEENVNVYLVNFPITKLDAFSHLQGVVPRGWENTGSTWDDIPGAGGKNTVARIGHSESGMGHGSLNLELHEISHPIDTLVLDEISSSSAFQTIHKQEQPFFLSDIYFDYPNEYFAEAFSYYFLNEETNNLLQQHAPKTYAFIEMLGDTVTRDTLNLAIEEALQLESSMYTSELQETLDTAIAVYNNTEASLSSLRNAEFTLRQAVMNATEQIHERVDQLTTIVTKGDYNREAAEQMIEKINRTHGSLLQLLVDYDFEVKLVNFPITELPAFQPLKDEKEEQTGLTEIMYDGAVGVSEKTLALQIGYNEEDAAPHTISLELSQIGRVIDRINLNENSNSDRFKDIHQKEQAPFLADSNFTRPENYFAEAFAYYFLSDDTRDELAREAPETYDFIRHLEVTSDKEYLHEIINQALQVPEQDRTEGFNRNLTHAKNMSNHPYASQFEVDEAAALLQAVLLDMRSHEEKNEENEVESNELALSNRSDIQPTQVVESNTLTYLIISLLSTIFASMLFLRGFSLFDQKDYYKIKLPFQK